MMSDSISEESESYVTARGTADGLIVKLASHADPLTLQASLRDFLISRSAFLRGSEVFIEWSGEKPTSSLQEQVKRIMKEEFSVTAKDAPLSIRQSGAGSTLESDDDVLSLFDGINSDTDYEGEEMIDPSFGDAGYDTLTKSSLGDDALGGALGGDSGSSSSFEIGEICSDEADCRMLFGTLRSGQRVETEHSLLVMGDVNSGAEVVAGGDIVVLGKLRGVAHAGAYDETGGGRVIVSMDLAPTQLRIGSVITRGAAEKFTEGVLRKRRVLRGGTQSVAEIARVEGNLIVVEPYRSRERLR